MLFKIPPPLPPLASAKVLTPPKCLLFDSNQSPTVQFSQCNKMELKRRWNVSRHCQNAMKLILMSQLLYTVQHCHCFAFFVQYCIAHFCCAESNSTNWRDQSENSVWPRGTWKVALKHSLRSPLAKWLLGAFRYWMEILSIELTSFGTPDLKQYKKPRFETYPN